MSVIGSATLIDSQSAFDSVISFARQSLFDSTSASGSQTASGWMTEIGSAFERHSALQSVTMCQSDSALMIGLEWRWTKGSAIGWGSASVMMTALHLGLLCQCHFALTLAFASDWP